MSEAGGSNNKLYPATKNISLLKTKFPNAVLNLTSRELQTATVVFIAALPVTWFLSGAGSYYIRIAERLFKSIIFKCVALI